MAEITPPCLTPLLRANQLDTTPFHFTLAYCIIQMNIRSRIKMTERPFFQTFLNKMLCLTSIDILKDSIHISQFISIFSVIFISLIFEFNKIIVICLKLSLYVWVRTNWLTIIQSLNTQIQQTHLHLKGGGPKFTLKSYQMVATNIFLFFCFG